MKVFQDLDFNPHPIIDTMQIARLEFPNGWGVSVAKKPETDYELAILKNGKLEYHNPISNESVIHDLNEEGVTSLMLEVQNLKNET